MMPYTTLRLLHFSGSYTYTSEQDGVDMFREVGVGLSVQVYRFRDICRAVEKHRQLIFFVEDP